MRKVLKRERTQKSRDEKTFMNYKFNEIMGEKESKTLIGIFKRKLIAVKSRD